MFSQCLNIPILEEAKGIQGINALVLHHCVGSVWTASMVFKTALMLACIVYLSFSFTQSLLLLHERILYPLSQEVQVPGLPLKVVILVGVCPNIIPITPQYSYYFGFSVDIGWCLPKYHSDHSPIFLLLWIVPLTVKMFSSKSLFSFIWTVN